MGFHATIGNGQTGRDHVQLRWSPRLTAGEYAVTTEEFDPITDGPATLAPDYTRGTMTQGHGLTIKGGHLTNGVEFRKLGPNREELKVAGGKLVLRKVVRKDRAAWVGEYIATGQRPVVLVMIPVIKGEPPVKADARDLLLSRHVLSAGSVY